MKRKYYMRGLGIGILVTAILCAIALPKKTEPMTDAEIIARAKELGYEKSEGGVTADDIDKIKEKVSGTPGVTGEPEGTPSVTEEPEGTPGPTPSPVPTPEPPNPPDEPEQPEVPATPTPAADKKPTATPASKPTATLAPTKKPTEKPKATATPAGTVSADKKSYAITVERGMTATKVAERLAAAGAISDVEDFISYLRKNNLTDFINIGKFTISEGASYKEIAHILTGR